MEHRTARYTKVLQRFWSVQLAVLEAMEGGAAQQGRELRGRTAGRLAARQLRDLRPPTWQANGESLGEPLAPKPVQLANAE
eukprot:1339079-Alexandrium_andersonii.AAC.1